MPRSVIRAVYADKRVKLYPLPARSSKAKKLLVWRKGNRSAALDALHKEIGKVRET
jgi:hypothetical protein